MATITATVCISWQEKKEEQVRDWSDLPLDLLGLILARLYARDCTIFRAICRTWQSVPAVPRPLLLPNDSQDSQSPCLAFYHMKNRLFSFFHPIYNATYEADIPELATAVIRSSKCGWLLMSQGNHSLFFFNPFKKVKIELPPTPVWSWHYAMCFSSPPTSSDCFVIGVSSFGSSADILTLKLGENVWRTFLRPNIEYFNMPTFNPTLCNGLYYCFGHNRKTAKLAKFDPNGNSWDILTGLKFPWHCGSSRQTYLVESDGDLFAVSVACDGTLSICRLDISKMVWVEVKSLGDKSFYISSRTSTSEKAAVKGIGNKIYFPRFHDGHGVFYSLSTRKYHTFAGSFSSAYFYNTKEMKHCSWIELMLTTDDRLQLKDHLVTGSFRP